MTVQIDFEARISALEVVMLTHVLQSGLDNAAFDPRAFAVARRDAWAAVGKSICEECGDEAEDQQRFSRSYAAALERLGHLLVDLAEPVQEAIDEIAVESR